VRVREQAREAELPAKSARSSSRAERWLATILPQGGSAGSGAGSWVAPGWRVHGCVVRDVG
jgi:hypothetical protein